MELKPPALTGTTSQTGNELQRQVAKQVTERWEAELRKKQRMAMIGRIKLLMSVLLLCGMAGGGIFLWRAGYMDGLLEMFAGKDADGAKDRGVDGPKDRNENDGTFESLLKASRRDRVQQARPAALDKDARERMLDAYSAFAGGFKGVSVDYWRNAPENDRPGKSKSPMKFKCLVADEAGAPVFLELNTARGAPMKVRRISANAGAVEMTKQEFDRLVGRSPYLVARDGRAYFAASRKHSPAALYPVPDAAGVNPSKIEFGSLYGLIEKMRIPAPKFRYDVQFVPKDGGKAIEIGEVGYGESLSRGDFARKAARYLMLDAVDDPVVEAFLKNGGVRFVPVGESVGRTSGGASPRAVKQEPQQRL